MEEIQDGFCQAYQKNGKRCNNKAKYGHYCGRHVQKGVIPKEAIIPKDVQAPKKDVQVPKEVVQAPVLGKEVSTTCAHKLLSILENIMINPVSLLQNIPSGALCDKLNSSTCSKKGQGRANGHTTQEASFAFILENNGFQYLTKKTKPATDGMYYVYQPNGTQRSPDFTILYYQDGTLNVICDIDMKQSNTEKIVLNDGWFIKNTIYILSYKSHGQDNIVIGLGQDIPSVKEQEKWEQILKIKKELNSGDKQVDSLNVYFRFANHYSCNKFNQSVKDKYTISLRNFLKKVS